MKRILLAGGAIATLGAAAWAMDGDKQHARIHSEDGQAVVIAGDIGGPIVEVRGDNGERTLHMERDGEATTIRVDGTTVEVRDGEVIVDGQRVTAGPGSMIVVDGDDVRVIDRDFEMAFDAEFAAHMTERAERLARMHEDFAESFVFEFDADGLESEIMDSLEEALADLDERRVRVSGDWDDLSAEEREEVRETLREAREEIRDAMREVREEMEGERRHIRLELREAERELARAGRELARAEREAERERHRMVLRHVRDSAIDGNHRSIRVEQDDDGRRRVWIDGEEQTGDDLVDWLNRLETDRLAGGGADSRRRHVERLELDEDDDRRVLEFDNGRRVVILERHKDDGDE